MPRRAFRLGKCMRFRLRVGSLESTAIAIASWQLTILPQLTFPLKSTIVPIEVHGEVRVEARCRPCCVGVRRRRHARAGCARGLVGWVNGRMGRWLRYTPLRPAPALWNWWARHTPVRCRRCVRWAPAVQPRWGKRRAAGNTKSSGDSGAEDSAPARRGGPSVVAQRVEPAAQPSQG